MASEQKPRKNGQTDLVHLGRNPADQHGFLNCPIYRGSTTLFKTLSDAQTGTAEFKYGTHGNPTVANLERAWTAITGAAGTCILSSGMHAVAFALLSVTKAGDNVLLTDSCYFPTRRFANNFLKKYGVSTIFYDPLLTPEELRVLLREHPNTTALFMESPGSQTFDIQDVPGLAAVAREHHVASVLDNTWATPLFFDAHGHGCDISVEAGTKYLGGHSDILLGMVSANAAYWPQVMETYDDFQATPGNEDCFLALRGMRTMHIRLKESERRALEMAQWLEQRDEVQHVLHPALPSFPGHARWKRDFRGSSGVFSIILQPTFTMPAVEKMLNGMHLFGMGFSWGGYESLIMSYDVTTSRVASTLPYEGILVRLQIGYEDMEDLKEELEAGFAVLRGEKTWEALHS